MTMVCTRFTLIRIDFSKSSPIPVLPIIPVMMMMMICFCGMVDRRKAFGLISSRDHCQRSSPSQISDTPRAGFEPAQNLSSELCWMKVCSNDNHYTTVTIILIRKPRGFIMRMHFLFIYSRSNRLSVSKVKLVDLSRNKNHLWSVARFGTICII